MLELIWAAPWKTWGACLLYTINICLCFPNNTHTYENHGGEQRRNGSFQCAMCKACRLNGLNSRSEKCTLPGDSCSKVPWNKSDLPFHEVNILNTMRYTQILCTRQKYRRCVFSVLQTRKMPSSQPYFTIIYDLTDFSLPWFAAVPWWVFILQPFGMEGTIQC